MVREPLGGADCAQRKAAAAVGVVADLDHIVWPGSSHYMLAFGVAHALGTHFDLRVHSCFFLFRLDDLLQGDCGAGRRVELGLMMRFFNGEGVAMEPG